MMTISDEFMISMLSKAKFYNLVLLKAGLNSLHLELKTMIWERARKNFALREEGLQSIVTPVSDDSDFKGMGIINANADHTRQIKEEDLVFRPVSLFMRYMQPAVSQGIRCLHKIIGFLSLYFSLNRSNHAQFYPFAGGLTINPTKVIFRYSHSF